MNDWLMACSNSDSRQVLGTVLATFNELHVKHLGHVRKGHLDNLLGESFAEADSLASIEWLVGVSTAFFTARSTGKGI